MTQPSLMTLGKIVRPHGVRGELRMKMYTPYPEYMLDIETVYLNKTNDHLTATPYTLKSIRFHGDAALLTIEGITDRSQADLLREQLVLVPFSQGAPLEEGEFYLFQLIGVAVYTHADQYVGKIKEIFETGANDVFVLETPEQRDILIPDTDEVVLNIDLDAQKMIINPIPGLLSDDE